MNQSKSNIWKQITTVYQQWDQDRSELMTIDDLYERLPDVERELIGAALAEAASEGKLSTSEENNAFRIIPNH